MRNPGQQILSVFLQLYFHANCGVVFMEQIFCEIPCFVKKKDVPFIVDLYHLEMNWLPKENCPEAYVDRLRFKKVLVRCSLLNPPLFSHVVNFSRLELPLHGCYENQIEAGGNIVTVRLRPGSALFASPNL